MTGTSSPSEAELAAARKLLKKRMQLLRFTTAGSVDDGKSTLIGRLLVDTRQVFEDQLKEAELTTVRRGQTGMDLALALVDADWGHDVALQVARYNVMYMVRPGGQSQFSAHLVANKAEDASIARVLDFILNNLQEPLSVTQLAARACMSDRSFARKFADEPDMTPAQYVEAARFQAARVALEQSDMPIEQVARKVGFMNPERMRRVFVKHLGISASDYRARFNLSTTEGDDD